MKRAEKIEYRKERRSDRAAKKGRRSAESWENRQHPDKRCNDCGGMMPWCTICNCYTQTCCVDWELVCVVDV